MAKTQRTSQTKQVEKFREAARDLGCDESEEHFDEALRRVAKAAQPKTDKRTMKQREKPNK